MCMVQNVFRVIPDFLHGDQCRLGQGVGGVLRIDVHICNNFGGGGACCAMMSLVGAVL